MSTPIFLDGIIGDYNAKKFSKEERLKIFEFLASVPEPFRVRDINQSGKYARINKVIPFSELLSRLEVNIEKYYNKEGKFILQKLEKDGKLFYQLRNWTHIFSGSQDMTGFLKYLGIRTVRPISIDEAMNFMQDIIDKNFVNEILFTESNGKRKFFSMLKSESLKAYKILHYASLKDKRYDLGYLVNEWHPEIMEKTGFPASKMLGFENFSMNDISRILNKKWYDSEEITREKMISTGIGSSVVYMLREGNNKRNSSAKKKKSSNYAVEASKLMEYTKCTGQDITAVGGSYNSIGKIMEAEFAFVMSIVKKLDPSMSNFPELKKYFDKPITHVANPHSETELTIANGGSKNYITDGFIVSDGINYIVEIKNTDYNQRKKLYSSLGNFAHVNQMANGRPVDKKILLISQQFGNVDKLGDYCRDFGWKIMDIGDYEAAYNRAIKMLFDTMPSFQETSPLNTMNTLNTIHNLAFFEPHLIYTRGHRKLRILSSELLKKNYRMINDGLEINNVGKYDPHYSMRLSDLLQVYKFNPSHLIPKDMAFVDVESLGSRNTGSPLFMIGVGYSTGDDFIADIYVSPTIFDEKDMLINVQEKLKKFNSFFTYNGKGVDVPFIEERLFTNRIRQEVHFNNHIDGYHDIIRKIVAGKHPSKLRNFEKIFLNIYRRGDISGEDIPDVIKNYHLGESDYIEDVIAHNFPDVFTMPFIYLFSKGHRFDKEVTELNYYDFDRLWNKNSDSAL